MVPPTVPWYHGETVGLAPWYWVGRKVETKGEEEDGEKGKRKQRRGEREKRRRMWFGAGGGGGGAILHTDIRTKASRQGCQLLVRFGSTRPVRPASVGGGLAG